MGRFRPVSASQYAMNTEDPIIQEQLVDALSYSWPRIDPHAAANWAQSLSGNHNQKRCIVSLIHGLEMHLRTLHFCSILFRGRITRENDTTSRRSFNEKQCGPSS